MMFGFWILIALFIAGLWWFGRASNTKTRCGCEAVPESGRSNLAGNHNSGGNS